MFDTSVTPTSYILSAAFRYSHLVFAATTYNAGVFITMEELLHDIAAHDLQNRRVVLLENGSWAPASGKEMQKILQPLKGWQQMEDTFTIRSALREDQTMQLERLAATLAAGLPPDSRCMMHLAGQKLPEKTLMDAAAVDALHRIEWRLIGCPGSRPPDSILAALTDPDTGGTGNVQSFDSPEDFEAALAAMKGG